MVVLDKSHHSYTVNILNFIKNGYLVINYTEINFLKSEKELLKI